MPFVDVLLFLEGFIIIKKGGNLSITTTNKNEDIMNDIYMDKTAIIHYEYISFEIFHRRYLQCTSFSHMYLSVGKKDIFLLEKMSFIKR